MGILAKLKKAVKAGQAACGRIWELEEKEVPCVQCGNLLDESGWCDNCGYRDRIAEPSPVLMSEAEIQE